MVAWISEDGAGTTTWKRKKKKFPLVIDGPEDDDPRVPVQQPIPVSMWQPKLLPTAPMPTLTRSHVPDPYVTNIHQGVPQRETLPTPADKAVDWTFGTALPWYQKNVIEPVAGNVVTGVERALTPFNEGYWEKQQRLGREKGLSNWQASAEAWRNTKLPFGVKGVTELAVDPANWVPGIGMVDYTKAAAKVKQAAPVVGEALQGIAEQGGKSVKQPFAPELGFAAGKAKKPVVPWDSATETHFQKWLDNTILPDQRDSVEQGIKRFVTAGDNKLVVTRGDSWSEIRSLAERNDYIKPTAVTAPKATGSQVVKPAATPKPRISTPATGGQTVPPLATKPAIRPQDEWAPGFPKTGRRPTIAEVNASYVPPKPIAPIPKEVTVADGWLAQFEPMTATRYKNVLEKQRMINRTPTTQGNFIETSVAQGAVTVTRKNGRRALQFPNGSFFYETDLSKTALDYADYLVAKTPVPETNFGNIPKPVPPSSVPKAVSEVASDVPVDVPKSVETPKPVAVEPVTSPAPAASGGVPPVEPPKTAVNPDDVARRFVEAINDPSNLRVIAADKAFKSEQLAIKAAKFMDNFTALSDSGVGVEEAARRATSQLSGKLERKAMTLGDLFSTEERAALFDMVQQKSVDAPVFEVKNRIAALTKALDEGVITDVKGVAGGSQRTRLEAVFGKPFVEAMDTASKKLQGTGRGQYVGGGKPLVPEVGRQGGLADIGDFVPTLEPQYAMGNKPPAPFAPVELSVGEQLKQAAFFNKGHVADFPNFPEGSVGKQLAILPLTAREQAMSALKRVGVEAIDTLNVPRAFITAFDVSAPGRQGLQLLVAHPVSGYKNLGKMFKALASESSAKASAEQVDSILRRAGERARRLYIAPTELKSGLSGLAQGEESYMSRLAYKIPGVKRSQRAYVTFLNGMRADVFNQGMKAMEQLPIVELKDYDALSNLINAASGRGDLPKVLKNSSPVLNALMFSPRLVMARLEYVPRIVQAYATGNPVLAKEATRQLVTFLGFGASVIGLYKLAGGKVENDPRSADFGKVTIGNSHVDIWGGYLQYSRILARAATSSTKVNGKVKPQTLGTTLGDAAQSKFSPITSLFWDIAVGKDYSYNPMTASVDTLKTQSFNRLVPLFAQDLIEAIRMDGTVTGIGMGALSGLGVGVTTYKNAQDAVQYNTGETRFPVIPQTVPQTTPPTTGGFKFQKKKVTK